MRTFIISFAAACLLSLTSANVCGGECATFDDCIDAGTCNLCLSGTCQHRCMENGTCDEKPKPVANNVCGGECATFDDCVDAGTCNLCLSGTCQHRCMTGLCDDKFMNEPKANNYCGGACKHATDCDDEDCYLCLNGKCIMPLLQ